MVTSPNQHCKEILYNIKKGLSTFFYSKNRIFLFLFDFLICYISSPILSLPLSPRLFMSFYLKFLDLFSMNDEKKQLPECSNCSGTRDFVNKYKSRSGKRQYDRKCITSSHKNNKNRPSNHVEDHIVKVGLIFFSGSVYLCVVKDKAVYI